MDELSGMLKLGWELERRLGILLPTVAFSKELVLVVTHPFSPERVHVGPVNRLAHTQ